MKATLAYLLLPVSGLFAYLMGRDTRTRFHGLQAIVLGLVWPIALYLSVLGPTLIVQVVFGAGVLVWFAFLVLTASGRDPRVPVMAPTLERLAGTGVRDVPRSTSGS